MNKIILGITLISIFASCRDMRNKSVSYEIDVDTGYYSLDTLFLQARSVVFPDKRNTLITMSIYGYGTHAYGDIYAITSHDFGKKWSKPDLIKNLKRQLIGDSIVRVFGDITPDWHSKSQTILCTGKSFFLQPEDTANVVGTKRLDIESLQAVTYAVYRPSDDNWSEIKDVIFPEKLENGDMFTGINAGCTQRFDLPDGNILLPIRYIKDKKYVSTVAMCSFDGNELRFLKHGSTFTVPEKRGLCEPSICCFKGEYFLTMRNDLTGYVAKSKDGLNYKPMKEWAFSDGTPLESYNTQQHWISHPKGLFLVYTRKGAGNDHIFRHRAPLFIAQVDPDSLCVIRETERILIPVPADSGDLGNFGITCIDDSETWVTAPVTPKDINAKDRVCNVLIAKIKWQ